MKKNYFFTRDLSGESEEEETTGNLSSKQQQPDDSSSDVMIVSSESESEQDSASQQQQPGGSPVVSHTMTFTPLKDVFSPSSEVIGDEIGQQPESSDDYPSFAGTNDMNSSCEVGDSLQLFDLPTQVTFFEKFWI